MIESIKRVINSSATYFIAKDENGVGILLTKENLLYLIGEVERLNIAVHIDVSLGNTVAEMHAENELLRKALEWYADRLNHSGQHSAVWHDEGKLAKQALERSKSQ